MSKEEQILNLRNQGKTYKEISEQIGCSKSTISYYCGKDQKEKSSKRSKKNRNNLNVILSKKISRFKGRSENITDDIKEYKDYILTLDKICYLTGRPIDLFDTKNYHFDHIIPISKGGSSDIDNLGLASRDANHAKFDLTKEDFIQLCKEVLEHNGYIITK